MEATIETPTLKIQQLNDRFRQTLTNGRVMLSHMVSDLADQHQKELVNLVRNFKDFSSDNDPHGEHDFGAIEYQGRRYFWKIDYYDTSYEYGSPDPSDADVTRRVLTIMDSSEY